MPVASVLVDSLEGEQLAAEPSLGDGELAVVEVEDGSGDWGAKDVPDSPMTNMEDSENAYKVIAACTVQVWDENEVYDDFTESELIDFLQGMDIKMFSKMKDFFDTAPKMTHELNYVNKEGNDRTIKLEGISDFF